MQTNFEDKLVSLISLTNFQPQNDSIVTDTLDPAIFELKKNYSNDTTTLLTALSNALKIKTTKTKKYKKILACINANVLNFISKSDIMNGVNTITRITKDDELDQLELTKLLNRIKRKLNRRLKIANYNPVFALFLLKPLCKT
jgi:hypothetical protein